LNTQIAGTQKEIQAVETKLEDLTKKLDDESARAEQKPNYKFDIFGFFKTVLEASISAENVRERVAVTIENGKYYIEENHFVEFLHHLHKAKEINGVLEVGTRILGKRGYPSRMLVRDVVKDYMEDTLKLLDEGKRVIHYGTPGYGKSMTGALIVKKKMGKKLIVVQQGEMWYFVPRDFPRACVVQSKHSETLKRYAIWQAKFSEVKPRPIFHLIDLQAQSQVDVIVFGEVAEELATVSPNALMERGKLKSWERQYGGAYRKVEPHWEDGDMRECYEKCYKRLFTFDEFQRRLYFWGNNPRNVFQEMNLVKSVLEPAISNLRPADVRQYLEKEGLLRETGERYAKSYIIHWLSDDTFQVTHKKIASPYVMQRLFAKAEVNELKELKAFGSKLVAGAARGDLPSIVAADWLERLAFDYLMEHKLNLSTCRNLRVSIAYEPANNIEIKGSKTFKYKNFSDVEFEQDYLYIPDWRTLESIDAFFLHGDVLHTLQVTFAMKHKIKNAGVDRLLRAASRILKRNIKYCFIFVVPEATKGGRDTIGGFKAQAYVTPNGDELKIHPKAEMAQLLFPLPAQL